MKVPQYTTRIGAPGPVPWFEGGRPIRDIGKAVLAQETARFANVFGQWDEEIQRARESSEITGRLSRFALGAEELLTQIVKLPADKQEEAFYSGMEQAQQAALDWTEGSREAKTTLAKNVLGQYTSYLIDFRRQRRRQEINAVVQNAELGWDTAVQTGNFGLAQDASEDLVRVGSVTSEVAQQRLKEFHNDAALYKVRRQMDALSDADVPWNARAAGMRSMESRLDKILQAGTADDNGTPLSEEQRRLAVQLKNAAAREQDAARVQSKKMEDARREEVGLQVYGDLVQYTNSNGQEGRLYSLVDLTQLYVGGILDKAQYDGMVQLISAETQANSFAAMQVEDMLDEVGSGRMTKNDGLGILMRSAPELTPQQRIQYQEDLVKEQSAWRKTIRQRIAAEIDTTVNPTDILSSEGLQVPQTVAMAAKMQVWDIMRDWESKDEPLTEEKILPLAVSIASQLRNEWKQNPESFDEDHGFREPVEIPSKSAIDKYPAPKTRDEWVENVNRITREAGQAAGLEYYYKYEGQF